MAKKPFEIQSADLIIGGVNLQAGTTGVVIPGVTQAANYRVEEVEDTDFDQTIEFTSGAPIIIDAVTFSDYVVDGASTGRATYSCDLDDDNFIDNLELSNNGGEYNSSDSIINAGADMYAYTGSAGNPFSPFVEGDWSEIPFRPKMRASTVESIGGGSGGEGLGSITLPAIEPTTYKGLQVAYGMVHSNSSSDEYNVNKIVIHKPATTTITINDNSNNDDFRVSGLSSSDVVAMFVFYGSENGPKELSTLQAFAEAAIDNVILFEGEEGQFNTVDSMKTLFADNYQTLASAAGGLYANFEFFNTNTNFTVVNNNVTQLAGTGFVFDIASSGGLFTVTPTTAGSGYSVGNRILVGYAEYGASDSRYNIVVTVETVDGSGGVLTASALPELDGFVYSNGTWTGLVGTNQLGRDIYIANLNYVMANDTVELSSWNGGSGYQAGDRFKILGTDILDASNMALASPDNDLIITVNSVYSGSVSTYTISGTLPRPTEVWPDNNINDGGADQYDNANYISTNLAQEIAYNSGNTETNGAAFGEGATYSFAYEDSIFALFVTGNSANYVETTGNSGADGDSFTEAGSIYDPGRPEETFDNAVTHINIVGGEDVDGIRFSDGTRLSSAEGVGRVKLSSPGERRIEEVYGYKAVTFTQQQYTTITATASRSAIDSIVFWFDTTTTTIDDVLNNYPSYGIWENIGAPGVIQFSLDNSTWYDYAGSIGSDGNEWNVSIYPSTVSYNQGDTIYFRYRTGGEPQVWWDQADLTGEGEFFRGAIIKYHAYDTNGGTMIGTIHTVNDSGDENVAHTEVFSGGSDGDSIILWDQNQEGQLRFLRTNGEGTTIKIQWSATVFYGAEFWD